jgi:hypothetical protein
VDVIRPILTAVLLYTHIEFLSRFSLAESRLRLQEFARNAPEWPMPWYEDIFYLYGRKVRFESRFANDRLTMRGPIGPRRLSMTTQAHLYEAGPSATRVKVIISVSRMAVVELLVIALILIAIGWLAGGWQLALIALAAVNVIYLMVIVRGRVRALATARLLAKVLEAKPIRQP